MITFDPVNKRIVLDSAYATAGQIYSRWKEWVLTGDNTKYEQAFSVLGGDPLGGGLFVASYFFLMNGWRIRPMEADHTLILEGNIAVLGGGVPVVQTLGQFNVSTQFTVPVQAQGISTSGSTLDIPSIIAAMQTMFETQMVKANLKQIADKPVKTFNGSEWV